MELNRGYPSTSPYYSSSVESFPLQTPLASLEKMVRCVEELDGFLFSVHVKRQWCLSSLLFFRQLLISEIDYLCNLPLFFASSFPLNAIDPTANFICFVLQRLQFVRQNCLSQIGDSTLPPPMEAEEEKMIPTMQSLQQKLYSNHSVDQLSDLDCVILLREIGIHHDLVDAILTSIIHNRPFAADSSPFHNSYSTNNQTVCSFASQMTVLFHQKSVRKVMNIWSPLSRKQASQLVLAFHLIEKTGSSSVPKHWIDVHRKQQRDRISFPPHMMAMEQKDEASAAFILRQGPAELEAFLKPTETPGLIQKLHKENIDCFQLLMIADELESHISPIDRYTARRIKSLIDRQKQCFFSSIEAHVELVSLDSPEHYGIDSPLLYRQNEQERLSFVGVSPRYATDLLPSGIDFPTSASSPIPGFVQVFPSSFILPCSFSPHGVIDTSLTQSVSLFTPSVVSLLQQSLSLISPNLLPPLSSFLTTNVSHSGSPRVLETPSSSYHPTAEHPSHWAALDKFFTSIFDDRSILRPLPLLTAESSKALKELSLSTFDHSSIPKEIGFFFRDLKRLILSNNKLISLPPELSSLVQLEELYVNSNRLSMTIPAEIGLLANLRVIDLSNNQLIFLPDEISNLCRLERLNLSSNQISFLPSGFSRLSKLCFLDLRKNLPLSPEFKSPCHSLYSTLSRLYNSNGKLTGLQV